MPTSWLIGSAAGCSIVVEHATVSGRHCRLTLDGEGYLLDDLGSTNGTYVNGRRLAGPERVNRGDSITLGPTVPLPWPDEPGRPRTTEKMALRIGREPDNDVVVNLPTVSGHHARVVWEGKPGELIIEDLGSANGTAVGAPDRKVTRAAVSSADTVYLGTHAIPVVQLLARFTSAHVKKLALPGAQLVIGRNADCDQIVDDPSVSGRHARLYRAGERVLVEDLGSTNGTFVNGERVERPQTVGPGDVIVLGSHALTFEGASRSAPPTPSRTTIEPQPRSGPQTLRTTVDAMASSATATAIEGGRDEGPRRVQNPWWLAAIPIVQAPLIGLGIVLTLRTAGTPALGGVLFGLGLASLWFGLSGAALLVALPGSDPASTGGPDAARLATRIAALSALVVFQCVVAAVTVASGAGLKGSGPAMLALLIATGLIGLALGLTIVLLAPRPALALGLLALAILPLWLFGGQSWPLPRMAGWARVLAAAAPSRWAFEGLLLLEADQRPVAAAPPGAAEGPPSRSSVLDEYFPAETDRMGLRADSIALGGTLVGLLATVGFIASAPRRPA